MRWTLSERSLHVPAKREMLFGLFCWFMFAFGFSLIFELFFDLRTFSDVYYAELVYLYGCCLLSATVFFPFLRKANLYVIPMELVKTVLIGLGAYIVLCFAVEWILVDIIIFRELFMDETTTFYNLNQLSIDMAVSYSPIPMYIGTIVMAPITEELLVRAMIFGPLCRKKPYLAYLVSSLLFSGLHIVASIGQVTLLNVVMLLLAYLPSGLVLGWAYQNTRCIYGPIALHCAINLYATLVG